MIRMQVVTLAVAALAGGLAAAVVATLTESPPAGVASPAGAASPTVPTEPQATTTGGCTAATPAATGAITAGSRTQEARDERYVVKAGDTLWGIATRYYEDAAVAMKRIKRRNGLRRDGLLAGELLVLPAAGRRGDRSATADGCGIGEAANGDAASGP